MELKEILDYAMRTGMFEKTVPFASLFVTFAIDPMYLLYSFSLQHCYVCK